ncbi:MAG TPA: RodZ domain-containing protein [Steroidobacteraceae bacterium]|jgi:cytoskeleton protein RodZ|nr:RodZ domain-containing protein [Steroidobacteraceae bacterium]
MSEVAPTLGERLKAERERRGMSTQKAADEMHLDAWVIDALESGDYQRLGPSVYARGHLKKYASNLGLSTADIVAGSDPKSAPAAAAAQPAGLRMRSMSSEPSNPPWPQLAAFAVLALVVGGVLWWRPWHPHSGAPPAGAASSRPPASAAATLAEQSADRTLESQGSDRAASESAAAVNGGALATTPASSSASTLPAAPPGSVGTAGDTDSSLGVGRARLRLSFSADSWVDVHDSAGRRVFAGSGRANSVKTLAGSAPLRVYLGFASGVQLELNGRAVAIGPQFVSGDVARFEAGADGVLRRDAHSMPTNGAPSGAAPPRG